VAPSLAFIGLVMTLWLATTHISLLVTGGDWVVATMFVVIFGSPVFGIVWTRVLKQTRPEVYAKIESPVARPGPIAIAHPPVDGGDGAPCGRHPPVGCHSQRRSPA